MASAPTAPGPTVLPVSDFDVDKDTEILHKAMKGIGCDEQAIIDIIAYRSNEQRQKLRTKYKTSFGKDLVDVLKSELKSDFKDAVVSLMLTPDHFDAKCLRKAMKGAGTDDSTLIEILCTRTSQQIKMIKDTFGTEYKRNFEGDIKSETSGDYEKVLIGLCAGNRDEGPADPNKAKEDAKALYDAGEGKLGTDEAVFQRLLVGKSHEHLKAVFDEYETISDNTLEEAIKSEMSFNLKNCYLTIISYIRDPQAYYVNLLYKAMKGLGTDEDRLIRVIVYRSEWDLEIIKEAYKTTHKVSLADAIRSDTSGNFRKLLLTLIRK
ncbi:annexin A13-like [Amphiura filiformis]|uniref:annexin A13-like n=1 Tax=Amphiura filiformis TaxID=82378 RepID=UPI003B20EDB1